MIQRRLLGAGMVDIALRVGNRAGSTVRRATEPAPTIVASERVNDIRWELDADAALDRRARREPARADDPD